MLRPILEWGAQVAQLEDLRAFSFDAKIKNLKKFVQEPFAGNSTLLAWMNGFALEDVQGGARSLIKSLLTRKIPKGKRRWGFKEIRYGIEDDVPGLLLSLFPHAKVLHTVRHPVQSVESAILEWKLEQFMQSVDSGDDLATLQLYESFALRWIQLSEYFELLKGKFPTRIFDSHLERRDSESKDLCEFLGVDLNSFTSAAPTTMVNSGATAIELLSVPYREVMEKLAIEWKPKFAKMALKHRYDLH